MGKKKSVVLMTIITIVIVVLCAVVAFPSVTLPGTNGIKKWNPAAMQYDLGAEFSGGHYAYYYPEGVITETEYVENVNALTGTEQSDYVAAYKQFGGLYLSTDPETGILENDAVSENFQAAFNKSVEIITARYAERAKKSGSSYRVSVVDNYAIRVELSATESSDGYSSASYASQAFTQFAQLGDVTFETGTDDATELVSQMKDDELTAADLIRSVTVMTKYKVAYLHITFTADGKEMLKAFKDGEDTSLKLMVGENAILNITEEVINTKNEVEYGLANEADKLYADTVCALINSAIETGSVYINAEKEELPMSFRAPTSSEIATYAPASEKVFVWVCVAVFALLVAACVLSVIKYGGFGVMNVYSNLSYFVITALCFAFITGGVFAVNLATILVFFAGLALINLVNAYIYGGIKKEVAQGKTVQSSVKNGYNKTLSTVADIYVTLALGAVALLLGVASLNTFACQALICLVAGAFCSLLWGRVINYTLLSASKDKYKYFKFVREEDEDDE